jgi:NCAIR mutase (PurE)-related protein
VPPSDFNLDLTRLARIGLEEAVFGSGKTIEQIAAIIDRAAELDIGLLVTRLDPDTFEALPARHKPRLDYDALSRTGIFLRTHPPRPAPVVAIVTAGTGDLPAGREAARTLEYYRQAYREYADVGVAGLWRLLDRVDEIKTAAVVIVVAGMDAALISVVGGLVPASVIAVPTSVGYGVARGGTAALHSALACCAPGVTVVNIDNGYGAACAALRVLNTFADRERQAPADARQTISS